MLLNRGIHEPDACLKFLHPSLKCLHDPAAIPNLKNIDSRYLNTPFDPDNKYSAPYAMSTTIIGYNEAKIKELGLPTDTWAVIFDPKYLEKVKGRVTVLDSADELFAAALKTSTRSTGTRPPS